jgi:uncharacterized repeat protein (TIGR03803 family)
VVYKVTQTGQFSLLYSFAAMGDGSTPYSNLIFDPAGNLYGTTLNDGLNGAGVVFKLSPSGEETVLHAFVGPTGGGVVGALPKSGVARDAAGNLYGTDSSAIYEIEANGNFKNLAVFGCKNVGEVSGWSGVTLDSKGNLYGTTTQQAVVFCGPTYGGVFKLTPSGTLTQLYAFPGASAPDFDAPVSPSNPGVAVDSSGNVYGATPYGGVSGMVYEIGASGAAVIHNFTAAASGTSSNPPKFSSQGGFYGSTMYGGAANAGTVYEISAAGNEKVLYSFTGGEDGSHPNGSVDRDASGNIYGATSDGGASGQGVVYKVSTSGQFTLLHTFSGGADGGYPDGGVTMDGDGNLYGTAFSGGTGSLTGVLEGVIFKIDPSGDETVLYNFTGLSDGGSPESAPTLDRLGNLYGTTVAGGNDGVGVVYKLTTSGVYSVLHTFTGLGAGGGNPVAPVVLDTSGNIYGAAAEWGTASNGDPGWGLIYKISTTLAYTVLYTFSGGTDGGLATAPVTLDKEGNIYGTTAAGGGAGCADLGCGVAFEITPAGQETVLHTFENGADGVGGGTILLNQSRDLFGNAASGGLDQGGLIYKMVP